MNLRVAVPEDVPTINELIAASKSVWNYEEGYLKKAIPLIQIDRLWLENHICFVIEENGVCGFVGLENKQQQWILDHLWIRPDRMRLGLGRRALEEVIDMARKARVEELRLLPDPPAEGFYQKLGAQYTGWKVPSRIEGGPVFQEMVIDLRRMETSS